jgi:hypothetical protein
MTQNSSPWDMHRVRTAGAACRGETRGGACSTERTITEDTEWTVAARPRQEVFLEAAMGDDAGDGSPVRTADNDHSAEVADDSQSIGVAGDGSSIGTADTRGPSGPAVPLRVLLGDGVHHRGDMRLANGVKGTPSGEPRRLDNKISRMPT